MPGRCVYAVATLIQLTDETSRPETSTLHPAQVARLSQTEYPTASWSLNPGMRVVYRRAPNTQPDGLLFAAYRHTFERKQVSPRYPHYRRSAIVVAARVGSRVQCYKREIALCTTQGVSPR